MTMQFLASVRRNQKQWMVVVTILSIFAFLFDDVVRGANNLTANSTALFFAVLCAGGMSVLGYPRRHTVLFGVIGFVVGGGVALVGATYAGPKPLARTVFETLTRQKLVEMQNRRMKVNRFLAAAVEKVNKQASAPNFGDTSETSMVAFSVLKREARRLGVVVSDDAVNRFLKEATQDKLSQNDYETALRDVGIGESELFDIIREELEAQLVGRLLSPPANVQQLMAQFSQGRLSGRVAQLTPEQLWENFRKLHVREQLTSVAVPVSEFVKLVPEPSETELREYFDKRKSFVGDDRGNPGFLELPKVQLAYLTASNLEAYEKGLPGATDQEVVDYYLAHKEEYRVFEVPDFEDMKLPDLKGGAESVDPAAPADAASPANGVKDSPVKDAPAKDAAPDQSKPDTEKPAEGDKPKESKEEPKGEAPKPESAKDEAPKEDASKDQSSCGDDEPAKKDEPATKDAAAEKKDAPAEDAAKPAKDEPAKPASGGADKPAAKEDAELPKPAAADKGEAEPPAPALPTDESLKLAPPKLGAPNRGPMAPAKYRELDDELKLQIREKLLLEKAFEKMGDARDEAFAFMTERSLNYLSASKDDREKLAANFADECKTYAKDHGFEYHETKPMTRMELATSMDEQIGSAVESSTRRNARTVADLVFDTDSSGRRPRIGLYSPQRAESPKAKYAYWKIAEIPSQIPDLKNESTRQLVVASWKFEKARELAMKRAGELAELAKKAPADMAAALSGQTINGTSESPAVVVRETPKFTWMRVSQSVPTMGLAFPMESSIDGIDDQPGSDFFKLIFEQLGDGDIGLGLNQAKTAFFVVKVHDRDGAEKPADGVLSLQDLQQQFLKERFNSFIPTPYDFLGTGVQQMLDSNWRQNFNKHFGIKFESFSEEPEEEQ